VARPRDSEVTLAMFESRLL